MTDFFKDESAVRDLLARITDAWQHLRGEAMTSALGPCFANEVVVRGPGFALAGKGREAAVQGFVDFTTQAQLKAFTAEEPAIDIVGDTAVAQYQWQMTYVLAGQEYTEQGHDLFVFSRIERRWLVVWRALLSS